jgi:thiol-disulfide isomerase/thioredoxin
LFSASCALVVEVDWAGLEESTTQKVVLFHEPGNAASDTKLGYLRAIEPDYEEFVFNFVDVTAARNVDGISEAGFTKFPQVFTQVLEGNGPALFDGEFTPDTFAAFHAFQTTEVTEHNVLPFDLALLQRQARKQPVFVKMFEQWCGHCKKMKKHFLALSNEPEGEINGVQLMEVECSKDSPVFCKRMGAKGYPSVMLVRAAEDGSDELRTHVYTGQKLLPHMKAFLADQSAWQFSGKYGDHAEAEEAPALVGTLPLGELPDGEFGHLEGVNDMVLPPGAVIADLDAAIPPEVQAAFDESLRTKKGTARQELKKDDSGGAEIPAAAAPARTIETLVVDSPPVEAEADDMAATMAELAPPGEGDIPEMPYMAPYGVFEGRDEL